MDEIKETIKEYYNFYNEIPLNQHFNYLFHIPQNIIEIEQVISFLGERKFEYFVELGCDSGGSLWLYSNLLCTKDAKIAAIDPGNSKSLQYTIWKLRQTEKKVIYEKNFSHHLHEEYSLDWDIDLLHIDAGHHYYAVKNDFFLFKKLMKPGGIILLHDTFNHPGCIEFRKELEKQDFKPRSFVDKQQPLGITLVEV